MEQKNDEVKKDSEPNQNSKSDHAFSFDGQFIIKNSGRKNQWFFRVLLSEYLSVYGILFQQYYGSGSVFNRRDNCHYFADSIDFIFFVINN